jgi:Holliday junction resolvasome RuvABC endonuclease subunit
LIIQRHKPDYLLVEETIYLQNPKTTRLLAYIVGGIFAQAVAENVSTGDVGPLKWKSGIGYKNVRKAEIAEWAKELGSEKEAKKRAQFERKNRVKVIIEKRIPGLQVEDLDIVDAIGIGLWGLENQL